MKTFAICMLTGGGCVIVFAFGVTVGAHHENKMLENRQAEVVKFARNQDRNECVDKLTQANHDQADAVLKAYQVGKLDGFKMSENVCISVLDEVNKQLDKKKLGPNP